MKDKKEFRYQFLKWETVGTGKFRKMANILSGLGYLGGHKSSIADQKIEITKEVAVVFDKRAGKLKIVDR